MDERLRFVARLLDGERMTTLCTEFLEERDRSCEVLHNNADVVHPLECHAADYTPHSAGANSCRR